MDVRKAQRQTALAWLHGVRAVALMVLACGRLVAQDIEAREIRVGVIGLDTSHAVEFTRLLNDPDAQDARARCRVICAYPLGSRDIESSASRIPKYTAEMEALQVEIVDSIESLVERVDAVLLETNDGRLHLTQVLPVLKAKRPVFMDKPAAASLADVIAIYAAARHYETPLFSASALRFSQPALEARAGKLVGRVLGCDTYSPATLEPTHTDLYWYGIHGVEQLFTVMGTGCESVSRIHTEGTDVVVGTWRDGRIGTFRGTRTGKHLYGGVVFGEEGAQSTGGYQGYGALVTAIAEFFQSGIPPVQAEETIELYAFMSAADACKSSASGSVQLADVLADARHTAESKLRELRIGAK